MSSNIDSSFSSQEITREEIESKFEGILRSTCDKLEEIWEKIGISRDNCQQRYRILLEQVNYLFESMVGEEEESCKNLKEECERHLAEIEQLCLELGLLKYEPDASLQLLQMRQALIQKKEELSNEKNEKVEKLQKLQREEKTLCNVLDMPEYSVAAPIPTALELKELQEHVNMLKYEKRSRLKTFHELKLKILAALEKLEFNPDGPVEKEVVYSTDDEVSLSDRNITNIRFLYEELVKECNANEKLAEEQRQKLQKLWRCLKTEAEHEQSFLAENVGFKKSVIQSLMAEVQRCQELKKAELKTLIINAKVNLADLWDKCQASAQQKEKCSAFYKDDFSEEQLDIIEEEIELWETRWIALSEFFASVQKLKEVYHEIFEFEKKLNDPKRFRNRGGVLLQLEKDKKRLAKNVQLIEDRLKILVFNWEKIEGESFYVGGKTFHDFMLECQGIVENQANETFPITMKPKQKVRVATC